MRATLRVLRKSGWVIFDTIRKVLNNLLAQQMPSVSLPSVGSLDPGILKLTLIAALVFLLLMLLAFTRHHIVSHSMRGLWAGLTIGALAVVGLEAGAYYLYANYIVGTKAESLPKNFQVVLEDSSKNLMPVLGKSVEAKQKNAKELLTDYNLLSKDQALALKKIICEE